jgi:mannitol 2-dehydrogenase
MNAQTQTVLVPLCDRSRVTPGIAHIGLGNVHPAHMAVYLGDLMSWGPALDWGSLATGVRPSDAAMLAQDCLSTAIELDPRGRRARRVGAMIGLVELAAHNGPLIAAMSRPEIRIVSLTVTERGLCRRCRNRPLRSFRARDRTGCPETPMRPPPPSGRLPRG